MDLFIWIGSLDTYISGHFVSPGKLYCLRVESELKKGWNWQEHATA
jgi:hypothetical protein